MELSVTTDYARDTGDPSPYLRRIADAGFSHVHWCHHWNTDFLYSTWEIGQIRRWLTDYGLRLCDLHGAVGPEKDWASPREYARLSGVELVQNRMETAARLGGETIIMHVPKEPGNLHLERSLQEIEPFARARGVRIALENTGNFDVIEELLARYDASYLGLCYDAGHGNVSGAGLERLAMLKDRLISVHLHDNDGSSDQHMLPFSGTVEWRRLARIIGMSAYAGPVSLEVSMVNAGIQNERAFLKAAHEAGTQLHQMIDEARDSKGR